MNDDDPLAIPKDELEQIIVKISSEKSAVGIDAQYTHAVIIKYLQHILKRIENIEGKLENKLTKNL